MYLSGDIATYTDRYMSVAVASDDYLRSISTEARNADYNEAEKIIAEKAPIAPIYQYSNGRLIKPWLKGYPINNPEDVAYTRTMYILQH